MLGAAYGTVEDIEIMWVVVSFFGLIYSILNFRDSREDLKAIDEAGIKNGRRLIAKTSVLTEGGRAVIQAIFLVVGFMALTLPSPPTAQLPLRAVIASFCARWGFITASLILSWKGYLVRQLRHNVVEEE